MAFALLRHGRHGPPGLIIPRLRDRGSAGPHPGHRVKTHAIPGIRVACYVLNMPATPKPYWVYVLYSDAADRFYTGVTEHVAERLEKHNRGRSRWTARHRPWRLVFRRRFPSLTDARRFENLLKRQKGGRGFYQHTGLARESLRRSQGP